MRPMQNKLLASLVEYHVRQLTICHADAMPLTARTSTGRTAMNRLEMILPMDGTNEHQRQIYPFEQTPTSLMH